MTDPHRELTEQQRRSIDELWEPPEASSDFAAGVLAAHFGDHEPVRPSAPRARARTRTWFVLAAAAVLMLGIAWGLRAGSPTTDSLDARSLETVALGDRATAVAQPGAKLAWSVETNGTTRIDQHTGRVFYRVDHGERFDVVTPAGTVTVTGTCFEVDLETHTMNPRKSPTVRAGALGAALASALVVTVYEGGVVLANEHGSVDVAAGQVARASDSGAPVRFDADGPRSSDEAPEVEAKGGRHKPGKIAGDPMAHINHQARALERIREEKDAQAARIQQLERQVVELGGSVDPASPEGKEARAKLCANQSRGGSCPFLDPDQETLEEMARCGTIKIDSLGFVGAPEPPAPGHIAERLGVTDPQEAEKLDAAAMAQYEDYNSRLEAMYLELGGSEDALDGASGDTLRSFIFDQLDPELLGGVQRQIAEERAGLRDAPAAPASLSIEQRVARLMAEDGNRFEELVADQLGPERARELRREHDGWPGSTSVHSSDCRAQ